MIVNNHIEQEDLALYAMHLLPEAQADAITAHLDECEGCADLAALLRGDLAALAMTTEMHSAPATAKQRLMTQVAREKKIIPISRPVNAEAGSPLASRLLIEDSYIPQNNTASKIVPWISWVGWAVAAGLTVTVVDLYQQRDDLRSAVAKQASEMQSISADAQRGKALMQALTDQKAMQVTLNQTPMKTAPPQGRTIYLPEKGTLIFTASNLEPLQRYKTYELWLIPADGSASLPAGTFQPDAHGNASLVMPSIPRGVTAKAFGVTIEDAGGSQKPTLPIILSGA
jgi:hypothetical protein